MAVALINDSEVTNGTAGTSVTVTKPASIVDTGTAIERSELVAVIRAVGTPTITPPAGWDPIELPDGETVATDDDGTLTIAAFRKRASSEGASWTWTLGSSQRNMGWVGAYSGVDPDNPVYQTSTSVRPSPWFEPLQTLALYGLPVDAYGYAIGAVAAIRTADGSATDWDVFSATERADQSTNAGSGTDISGAVGDLTGEGYLATLDATFFPSQDQTAMVGLGISLLPYFVPFDGNLLDGIVVWAAFGSGPDDDLEAADWTDITAVGKLWEPAKLSMTHGKQNFGAFADSASCGFTLIDSEGDFLGPTGAYTDYFVENLPLRIWQTGFGAGNYLRGTFFLERAVPSWDATLQMSLIAITARGRLSRMQRNADSVGSPAYLQIAGLNGPAFGNVLVAHWPFEDAEGASRASASTPNTQSALANGVTFGADSSFVGSAPLAVLSANASITATVPPHSAVDGESIAFGYLIPTEPAADTLLMEVKSTGTVKTWKVTLVRGTSALKLEAFDSTNTSVLNTSDTFDESEFYGFPHAYQLNLDSSGADITYSLSARASADDTTASVSGTLSTQTLGTVTSLRVRPAAGLADAVFGQLAIGSTLVQVTEAMFGNVDDNPAGRFARVCDSLGIPYTNTAGSANADSVTMEVQPIATATALMRESEAAEGCMMHDSGLGNSGELHFPAVSDRYNVEPLLTLSISNREIFDIAPTMDSEGKTNDVIASRSGGASARVVDTEDVTVRGRRTDDIDRNVSDELLIHQAGWAVSLGTTKAMRFPTISWNMRRVPEHAQAWLRCHLSCRIDVVDPPSQYPPDDLPSILEGYTETLSTDTWAITAHLSPYGPYRVFEIGHDVLGRLDSDDSRATLTVGAADTDFLVTSNDGARWIDSATFPDEFPFAIWLGKEVIQVDSITGTTSPQTFNVTRGVNGFSREWAAGTQVRLAAVAVS